MRASLVLASGCQSQNLIADAAGPDTFTLEELHRLLATTVSSRVSLVQTHPTVGYSMAKLVGLSLRDLN